MPAEFSDGSEDHALSDLSDVSMPATSEAIATVVDTISDTLTQLQVPEQKRFEIALAVQEALANAVVHGCGNDPSKQVRCRLQTDPGPGFGQNLVPDPKQRENLYVDHGRGVYLIRQLMDEVHFENSGSEIR